jgi:hypothetical protein
MFAQFKICHLLTVFTITMPVLLAQQRHYWVIQVCDVIENSEIMRGEGFSDDYIMK